MYVFIIDENIFRKVVFGWNSVKETVKGQSLVQEPSNIFASPSTFSLDLGKSKQYFSYVFLG